MDWGRWRIRVELSIVALLMAAYGAWILLEAAWGSRIHPEPVLASAAVMVSTATVAAAALFRMLRSWATWGGGLAMLAATTVGAIGYVIGELPDRAAGAAPPSPLQALLLVAFPAGVFLLIARDSPGSR